MFIIANFHSSQIYLVQSAVLYVTIYFTLKLNFLNKYTTMQHVEQKTQKNGQIVGLSCVLSISILSNMVNYLS